ncbi:MAG: hypothetical protein AAF074_21035, partial [Pseudomonadota bacterium]
KVSKREAAEHGIDLDEATRWIEGLDRIHKTRRIQRFFDLSATPFAPTGKKSTDTALFDEENPVGATGLMRTWYTTKPCFPTSKSHISHLVGDSAWEGHAANVFE